MAEYGASEEEYREESLLVLVEIQRVSFQNCSPEH